MSLKAVAGGSGNTTNGITSLTGDVTASGPGAAAATLATAQPAVHTWALAQTFTSGAIIAAAATLSWTGRSIISSGADGEVTLTNAAANAFTKLNFGGVTTSFPALKRSSTVLQARLGDDSNFAPLQGLLRTAANATTGLTPGVLAALTDASIVITDGAGQAYRIPCII